MHIGDLDSSSRPTGNGWAAVVRITVHDGSHVSVAGASVSGTFTNGHRLADVMCTTDSNGQCDVQMRLGRRVNSTAFTVTQVTYAGFTYQPAENHDPDYESDGTSIAISRPW